MQAGPWDGQDGDGFRRRSRPIPTPTLPLKGRKRAACGVGRSPSFKAPSRGGSVPGSFAREQLIETANVMVVGLDSMGRVTIFNEAANRGSGYRREEVLGRGWFELVVPRERYP